MADGVQVIHGDALADVLGADVLGYPHALGYAPPRIPDASVDAIVTDPPYGLEFMGKDWDSFGRDGAGARAGFSPSGLSDGYDRLAPPSFLGGGQGNCRRCGGDRYRGDESGGRRRCRCASPEFANVGAIRGRAFGAWCEEWARECLRVLKPGGYLVAFGGTRTVHRLTCGIEDAGFEIRDGIDWIYGSGFPKSLDVSKAIDKAAGAVREVAGVGPHDAKRTAAAGMGGTVCRSGGDAPVGHVITAPATDEAARWAGWGTALKPAREPIVMARKPLAGTVAANVLTYGTGALNIDACRVPATGRPLRIGHGDDTAGKATYGSGGPGGGSHAAGETDTGRWPSNVVLSHVPLLDDAGEPVGDACADGCAPGCPVAELDAQSGERPGMGGRRALRRGATTGRSIGGASAYGTAAPQEEAAGYGDSGGASRFFPVFRYQAKAPSRERPKVDGTAHPTVKPLDLMRWLVRLVTPPGGTVLDLFAGSGTTAEACAVEGFPCVAIERESTYLPLIAARLDRQRHAQPALL